MEADGRELAAVKGASDGAALGIAIVVPLYLPEPESAATAAAFTAFLDGLLEQGAVPAEVFLSDSGPAERSGLGAAVVEALVAQRPRLLGRVRYGFEATEGAPLSRAAAMNLGVAETQSEFVLFLHLDCRLPEGALRMIADAVRGGARAGGFLKHYEGKSSLSLLQLTERYLNGIRTRWARLLVGTNAIWVERSLALEHPYEGSFLEDVELSDWLRRRLNREELRVLPASVGVSVRKYRKLGELRSVAVNAAIMALYRLWGTEPERLRSQLYRRHYPSGLSFWWVWLGAVFACLRGTRKP